MYIRPRGKELYRATESEFLSLVIAYLDLLLARWDARDRQLPCRARAVPLRQLRAKGVADHLLLWMLYQAHVEHLPPNRHAHNSGPVWGFEGSLLLQASSFLSLTELGEAFANAFLDTALAPGGEGPFEAAWDRLILGNLLPRYDKEDRVFSWGRHALKCFRQPSANQELVLCGAEEQGWVSWFDDPLPKCPGTNPKRRLHDTIKDLNRRQLPYFIHFKGDGSGQRVGWEYR
jgi:hypothetical protein